MGRFLRILLAITALVHVPVALGVYELARRLAWPAPGLCGALWASFGVAMFVGRARAGMPDRRRHEALVRFVDVPYFIHWCAAVWTLVPAVVATVVAPAIDVVGGAPPHLPMGAYVVTGDLVTSGTEYHGDIAEVVAELRAKHGVFVSMGNHDYFGEGEPLISMLRERGVRVLRNEGLLLEHAGAPLWLAGIDDTWTRRDDMHRALAGRPASAPAVLLAHDPVRFDAAADAGVELVLSGHTHGGQIAVPFAARALSLATLAHRYNVGVYRRGRATLYVHPGLGTTGPPMRLGAAPEVTILVLRADAARA
jgi:predicted MPP superfamily phosphohydrolase